MFEKQYKEINTTIQKFIEICTINMRLKSISNRMNCIVHIDMISYRTEIQEWHAYRVRVKYNQTGKKYMV